MSSLETEVRNLKDEVRGLKRVLWTLVIAIVSGAVVFAFSVFALLGQHP